MSSQETVLLRYDEDFSCSMIVWQPRSHPAFVRSWKNAIAVGDGSVGFGLCLWELGMGGRVSGGRGGC